MTGRRWASIAGLCLALAVSCCGQASQGSAAADEHVDLALSVSPLRTHYYPGEDFSFNVTVTNIMAEVDVPTDPLLNYVKVLNVSARFSWMLPWERVYTNVSETSSWLEPGTSASEAYSLDLSVPSDALAQTYDCEAEVEYELHTAWGNITYTVTESYYGFVVTRTTGTSPDLDFVFASGEMTFAPGDEMVIVITFSNDLPDGVSELDVFPCTVTNVSIHISWMADGEYEWMDFSDTETWLSPDGTVSGSYSLCVGVPEDAPEATHSFCFKVDYVEAVPWGEENRTLESLAYSGLVISDGSGGVLGGVDDYALMVAVAAIALAAVSLAAVLHHRRETRAKVAAMGLNGDGYPVLKPIPGEQFPLESGLLYLVKEKRPAMAFAIYDEALSEGADGMLISREHPDRLREVHPFSAKSVIWLSRRPGDDHVDPTELSLVSLKITRFVEERKKSVVMIEGLEYLITQNDFETVLRFVNHLHDFVMAHDCAVVIVVDPRVLSTRELALLERSSRVVEPAEPAPEKPPEQPKPPEAQA